MISLYNIIRIFVVIEQVGDALVWTLPLTVIRVSHVFVKLIHQFVKFKMARILEEILFRHVAIPIA